MIPNGDEYRDTVQGLMALEQAARRLPEHMSMVRGYLRAGNIAAALDTLRECNGICMRMAQSQQAGIAVLTRWQGGEHGE